MAIEPTMAEILRESLYAHSREIHTAMPAVVQVYNAAKQTVDALPVVRQPIPRRRGGFVQEAIPVIYNIPVVWPRGGGYALHWKLAKGDHVLLVFSEVDTSQWRDTGEVSDAAFIGRHSLSYPFAIPGIAAEMHPLTPPVGDEAVFDVSDHLRVGGPSAEFVALANLVNENFEALKTWLSNHTHPAPGGATSKSEDQLPDLPSVSSSKLKAE